MIIVNQNGDAIINVHSCYFLIKRTEIFIYRKSLDGNKALELIGSFKTKEETCKVFGKLIEAMKSGNLFFQIPKEKEAVTC